MKNFAVNALLFLLPVATFAAILHDGLTQKSMQHSGIQANCPIHRSAHPDCHK